MRIPGNAQNIRSLNEKNSIFFLNLQFLIKVVMKIYAGESKI